MIEIQIFVAICKTIILKTKTMNVKRIIPILFVALLALIGCEGKKAQPIIPNDTYVHTVKVQEVIAGKTYSYLKVKEASESRWVATTLGDFSEGQTLYFIPDCSII